MTDIYLDMTKAQLERLIVETLTNEKLSSLGNVKKQIQSTGACKWNVSDPGIKIFFDVTSVGSMIRPGSTDKSVFGVGISLVAMLTNKVLHSVNHVGFALSDGSIIHATTSKGVVRENGGDVINNPKNYVIVNVGGNEGVLIDKFNSLKKQLYVDKDSYDWKGIVRQIPLIGKLLARLKWSENKPYRFFCSELVANLLVRCGVISYNELASIHEKQLTGLDKYDEVDPTKLFLLLKDKAELCPVVCDTNLNKGNIMNQNELRQLVKEAISELKEEASTKELQKLGFKPVKESPIIGMESKMEPKAIIGTEIAAWKSVCDALTKKLTRALVGKPMTGELVKGNPYSYDSKRKSIPTTIKSIDIELSYKNNPVSGTGYFLNVYAKGEEGQAGETIFSDNI